MKTTVKQLFGRRRQEPVLPGGDLLAARMTGAVPPGCVGVAVDAAGHTRRIAAGARAGRGEQAWCFHPGPYNIVLTPFLAAPEMGLQLAIVIDSPDPLVPQQRFDLYLASEADLQVTLAAFQHAIDGALQRELAQGHLDLPPCTSPAEWNAFRNGLNELLYTRFGVTVDECIPVDLAGQVDYATLLAARAVADTPAPAPVPVTPVTPAAPAFVPAAVDRAALRRLFLELPVLLSRLRLLDLHPFARQRALLLRLDHASLAVMTMPALALAAPGRALPLAGQQRRARHALRAVAALDEAWALLARAGDADALDEAERIAANLEDALAARRTTLEAA